MNIRKIIKMPVYRTEVLVIFTDEMQKVVDKYSSYPDATAKYEAITIDISGNPIMIFDMTPSHNVLAHEIFHAVDCILSHRNVPLISGSEEAYAYLIGHITEVVYKMINRSPAIDLQ